MAANGLLSVGTSGTNSSFGMRSWKCRITAASLRGIEIASALGGSEFDHVGAVVFRAEDHYPVLAASPTFL